MSSAITRFAPECGPIRSDCDITLFARARARAKGEIAQPRLSLPIAVEHGL
jgi:hypothetical protein